MDNYLPTEKDWTIGGKQFKQTPLGLDRIGKLLTELSSVFQDMFGNKKDLEKLTKLNTDNLSDLFGLVNMILEKSPKIMPRLLAVILDTTDDNDIALLAHACPPRQVMQILIEFIKQNDVKGIREDFLALREAWISQPVSTKSSPVTATKPTS